jgi:hypothetical protein
MNVLRGELDDSEGIYFVNLPNPDEPMHNLREKVLSITETLDVLFAFSLRHDELWEKMEGENSTLWGRGVESYLALNMTVCCTEPISLVSALDPLLKRAASPKVIFLTSPIGSVSDCASSSAHGYRVGFSALRAMVKSLSFEYQGGCVLSVFLGVFVGRFAPGNVTLEKYPRAVDAEVAARRLMKVLLESTAEDTGKSFWVDLSQEIPI